MPQVWVTVRRVRGPAGRRPVTKAFGGQVMGSMATALRRRSGPERVAGEHLQPAVAVAGPQAHPGAAAAAVRGEVRPGPAVAVPAQPGQRVIKLGGADRRAAGGSRTGCPRRPPAVRTGCRGRPWAARTPAGSVSSQPSTEGVPTVRYGMRAGAVGRRLAAAVARGDGDVQPGAGLQPVLGLDFQAERISLLAVRGAAQHARRWRRA